MRLIDANKLSEAIEETAGGLADCDQQNAAWALRKYAIRDITDAPTVDAVEVVHGRWLEDYETFVNDNGYESEPIQTGWVCSACGSHELSARNYCPNCGAKMDGDGND